MVDFFENLKMEQYGFKILIMVDFLGNSKDDTHHKKKTIGFISKRSRFPSNQTIFWQRQRGRQHFSQSLSIILAPTKAE